LVKGGAIYISCEQVTYDCLIEIQGSTSFSSNFAAESGGAIYWGDVEPIMGAQLSF
jgi:predicted outer membrane repeat protein